ncbi:replicative DNA helicase [Phyllobacterium trifolii]|uniref:DNA 5'-3' helicase n=1 Tax=Phyllobacterium trifolii TaxID=300193 RepID=A0A839U7D4_9HYPH|nr:DnaB-like helicase C-terminal domain-containing protein [Phyllobacterium trifolii]MBB3144910.1 replicative DNA helicase [Phyllobacterium trifolii]
MNAHQTNIRASLPDAIEAEQALLGAIFVNNDAYWRVAAFVKPTHFAEPIHQLLYETMGTMITGGRGVNPVTIKSYVPVDLKIGDMTVMEYMARLCAEAITIINAYDYGRAIIESWSRRRLVSVAQDLDELARNMPVDMTPEKIISSMADELTKIAQEGNERAGSLKYGVLLPKAIDRVARASLSTTSLIPWFLPEITMVAGDIRRGNHIGLMSDSGGGKTSFALQQCRHAALAGFRSAFFSIEVTDEEAALQSAAQASRIPLGRLDAYTMDTREIERIEAEVMKSVDIPFDIVGFADCTLSDIRIKMEAMKKSVGLDLVVIDHAKMIALPNPKDIFAERINALYRGLKAIAKSLDVAVVTLIQRNDEWKARWRTGGSIRPMMGDAYGGGSVKQNLDIWFSLYRPEPLYKELIPICPPERPRTDGQPTKREKMIRDYENSRGKAWIINHKRRRGEPGQSQQVNFEAEYTSFASSTSDMPEAFEGFFE